MTNIVTMKKEGLKPIELNNEYSLSYSFERWGKEEIRLVIKRKIPDSSSGDTILNINVKPEILQGLVKGTNQALEVFSDIFGNDEALRRFEMFQSKHWLLYDDE